MEVSSSSAETVEGSALSLERVDDIESSDSLSLGVFGVHNGVADDVLEEGSENSAGLLVDVGRDSLHTTSACKSADSRLGDAEDGLTEGLAAEVHALSARLATKSSLALATAAADLSSRCHLFLVFLLIIKSLEPSFKYAGLNCDLDRFCNLIGQGSLIDFTLD